MIPSFLFFLFRAISIFSLYCFLYFSTCFCFLHSNTAVTGNPTVENEQPSYIKPLFRRPSNRHLRSGKSTMGKTIITCVRHAQGYHNLNAANERLPDPDLTPRGEAQCRTLSKTFPSPENITHLVASPLRRTLYTCLLSFPTAVARGLKVLAVPELQEVSGQPCNVGSAPSAVEAEFGTDQFAGVVDLSRVHDGWNSKKGRWGQGRETVTARARDARLILREIAQDGDGDKHIIVVTHGGFLHYLTEDWDGFSRFNGTGWANTEVRSYEFADPSGEDPGASLVETAESKVRRAGTEKPLTVAERKNLAAAESSAEQEPKL